MKRFPTLASMAFVLTMTIALGCKSETADEPAAPATGEAAPDLEAAKAAALDETLASLSEDDRAIVLAQKICPVSGDDLGSMGPPLKVTVEGKDVFVCCDGCIDPLKAEPAKYLAELESAAPADAEAESADSEATE